MTYASGDDRPSVNERRELAREKAKNIRTRHKKKERRNRAILQSGLVVVALAVIAVVALVIFNQIRPPSPGPLNMLSDGIQVGEDFVATPTAAIQPKEEPVPTVRDEDSDVIAITVYLDYHCIICSDFEAANSEQVATWLDSGAATMEIHPIALLNSQSQGTQYSSRSANAAACVANYDPNRFYDYNQALFANQPEEDSTGLTDAQLFEQATAVGVASPSLIENCINDQKFKSWVKDATDRALDGPIADSDIDAVTGTPTVLVNGLKYTGAPDDAVAFSAFVLQAAGQNFSNENRVEVTPTPTPTSEG